MLVKYKKVYYCEFCKKYRLQKHSMEKHEEHCTLNPDRTCRVCDGEFREIALQSIGTVKKVYNELMKHKMNEQERYSIDGVFAEQFKEKIRKICENIVCPACALSCLRLAGINDVFWMIDFNYNEAMEDWRRQELDEARQNELDDMRHDFEMSQL